MREHFLPFSLPSIGEEEIAEVADSLRSGWITPGPKTCQFEREFAAYVGAKHAVAVNFCTRAMYLALADIGLQLAGLNLIIRYTLAATAEGGVLVCKGDRCVTPFFPSLLH